ncbi:MAG: DUF2851 family protein [SAR324 cluster bacterium]|nr:DUF2851 family protein [SAR324 cluster bacterium]MBL7034936.1 DUF2851 family protein [SAR324 cluster bacterium]
MQKKLSIPEMVIQQIWAEQDFALKNLRTVCGQQLNIEFPGWHNTGNGPDFKEVRLQIGGQNFLGAVEIHVQSSGWYSHQHETNPDYNAVVLHVVLYHNGSRKIKREDQREIPELELSTILNMQQLSSEKEAKLQLKKLSELPGRCGIAALEHGTGALKNILGHAAEQRIQQKTELLLKRWNEQKPEELLFQLLFKSLGFSPYAQVFEELAKMYQFRELRPYFRQSQRTTRTMVLSRWFGACGLFSKKLTIGEPTVRHEYLQWKATWEMLGEQLQVSPKIARAHRPQNSPERRLLGMFHHLNRAANDGLLKHWLLTLSKLAVYTEEKQLRKEALSATEKLFLTPDWEVWQQQLVLGKSKGKSAAQLVGKDRQIIIWANAVLPFFLAYARYENEQQLEKLLYQLFMILPAEASNNKTRFLEKRLWYSELAKTAKIKLNTFGNRQGLIQLQHDFCRNFHQGCVRCELPGLLAG